MSPLLANLFLDELDEEVLGAGYRLVRYADDFVVLAKDLDEAKRAREVVCDELAALGLRLHPEKTAVRSFADGFSFLGYLFVRSLVMEEAAREAEGGGDPDAERRLEPTDVPAASWLAQVPFARLRALVAGAGGRTGRRTVRAVPLGEGDPVLAPAKKPLYVSSPAARLRLDGGEVVVEVGGAGRGGASGGPGGAAAPAGSPEAPVEGARSADTGGARSQLRLPLRSLSHVTFIGHSRATLPVVLALAREGVPSFFCHRSGEVYAHLGPWRAEWGLWLEQAKAADDRELRVRFAREVVAARLANQAALAVRFGWARRDELAAELRDLARSAINQESLDSLLGLEGRGAALYFAALAESLDAEWGFAGRQRQPPPDPVNAMLSFGSTVLYNHASTALTAAGLDPRIGLFHVGRGEHHALASDLVEELRWLVEAAVWGLISRRRVRPEDFTASPDGRYPCWMTHDFRGRFVAELEDRLHTGFTAPGDELTTYRAWLAGQARQIARLVRREVSLYRPLRLTA